MRTPEQQEQFLMHGRFELATEKPRLSQGWFSWLVFLEFDSCILTLAVVVIAVLVWLMRRNYKA
jgi:hypothetical protein